MRKTLVPILYKEGRKNYSSKQHIRKQLNLNSHICKRYRNKILVETKNELSSTLLFSNKFTKENIQL